MERLNKFFRYELTDPFSFMALAFLYFFSVGFGLHMITGEDLVLKFPIAEFSGGIEGTIFGYCLVVLSVYILICMFYTLTIMALKEMRKKPVDTKLRNPYLCFKAEHFRKKTYKGK